MKCEKCKDAGYTEEAHGLIMNLCDCDIAREVAQAHGIPWPKDSVPEESMVQSKSLDDLATKQQGLVKAQRRLEGILNVSNSRTKPANTGNRSGDTGKPKQPKKPKAKKKARARTS